MRAKKRTFILDNRLIKAIEGTVPQSGDLSETKCRCCKMPRRADMTAVIDVVQYGFAGIDKHTTVFECQACKGFTFVDYDVEYDNE